jgi:hypothetical protein
MRRGGGLVLTITLTVWRHIRIEEPNGTWRNNNLMTHAARARVAVMSRRARARIGGKMARGFGLGIPSRLKYEWCHPTGEREVKFDETSFVSAQNCKIRKTAENTHVVCGNLRGKFNKHAHGIFHDGKECSSVSLYVSRADHNLTEFSYNFLQTRFKKRGYID